MISLFFYYYYFLLLSDNNLDWKFSRKAVVEDAERGRNSMYLPGHARGNNNMHPPALRTMEEQRASPQDIRMRRALQSWEPDHDGWTGWRCLVKITFVFLLLHWQMDQA